jgi:hypothetical protein
LFKKKYSFHKQIIFRNLFTLNFANVILIKSFQENQFLKPLNRISFFANKDSIDNLFTRFNTYQKLHCLISLSQKVPNKSYHYSRFFLNKQLNKLTLANTLK